MTRDEEAKLLAEVEQAESRVRKSLKKSKDLIAEYRAKLSIPVAPVKPKKAAFRFDR